MGRDPPEQVTPDLFSTEAVRDASAPPVNSPAKKTVPSTQRHVLPKNLRNGVKHLSDGELDLLHTATVEELKWRGRLPPNIWADTTPLPRSPSDLITRRSDKTAYQRKVDVAEVSLTLGQVNVIRAAFKAGVPPSRIARQFGISQANVRKALSPNESRR